MNIIFWGFCESGQGVGEAKRALYHCNYCNIDITGKIRIKCAVCPDFDLCVECFSVGAELTPHQSNHAYRVMVSNHYFQMFSFDVMLNLTFWSIERLCDDYPACNKLITRSFRYIVVIIALFLFIKFFNTVPCGQDNLSFPLICPDWNADEEILLLEVLGLK